MSNLPKLQVVEGSVFASSTEVASNFGKQHKHVLDAIRNTISDCPESFAAPNFRESYYQNEQGKSQPCFNLTRDAFSLLAMGFTGKAALKWKLRYIEAFNMMEKALTGDASAQGAATYIPGYVSKADRRTLGSVSNKDTRMVISGILDLVHEHLKAAVELEKNVSKALLGLARAESKSSAIPPPPPSEPDMVRVFWFAYDQLIAKGVPVDHSTRPDQIAITFPEFYDLAMEHLSEYGHVVYYLTNLFTLFQLLPMSRQHRMIDSDKRIRSAITGKQTKCWVFSKKLESVGEPETTGGRS